MIITSAKLYKHLAANDGSDAGFQLRPRIASKLQLEAFQYYNATTASCN